jgi:argonaute-like protein implicated in RNA metabolism and viral defense
MEWKLTVNKRVAAKQTEDNLVVASSDFWNEELAVKLEEIVKLRDKPCKTEAITIVVSVNDRAEYDIIKRFQKLEIDWLMIEKRLQT